MTEDQKTEAAATVAAVFPDQAWEDFHAKWTPICAAWKVAKLCRDLAAALPAGLHDAASQEAYLPGLSTDSTIVTGLVSILTNKADLLERANPLPIVPEEEDVADFATESALMYEEDRQAMTDLMVEVHTKADVAYYQAEQVIFGDLDTP